MVNTISVETAASWPRVCVRLASSIPYADTANAVTAVITRNPGICVNRSSLKISHAHRNIRVSCAKASIAEYVILPRSRVVIVTRAESTRSSAPLSDSSSRLAPAAPEVNSRNITPTPAA